MQSVFWSTLGGRRNATWEPTLYLEKELTKRWEVFAEYGGDFAQLAKASQVAHFGSAYKVGPRHQIDLHFGFGMTPATPSHFVAVGYSFRVDQLWGR